MRDDRNCICDLQQAALKHCRRPSQYSDDGKPLPAKPKSIIAMKGAPFTRKTEFATVIATSLSCPLLSIEDFLDVLSPDQIQIPQSPNTSASSPQPQDLAFQIICNITLSHLHKGISDKVVIDSPLSSQSHLDQLIELATSIPMTRLLIVECKPKNNYLWQMKFDDYLHKHPYQFRKWYKKKNWDEVKEAIIQYDYIERLDGYIVSKLILDPLSDYLYKPCLISSIRKKLKKFQLVLTKNIKFQPPPFIKAVKYMITRKEGDGPDIVVYHQWNQSRKMAIGKQMYCRDGHTITKYTEEGIDEHDVKCMACGEEVKGAAYTCDNCRLSLHKDCAESSYNTWGSHCSGITRQRHGFPEEFACISCRKDKKHFSVQCASCLFNTHLKCRLMPTVIRHDCEENLLSVVLLTEDDYQEVYKCSACGTLVQYSFYSSKDNHSRCYHIDCLTKIPSRVKHVHGGHHHNMLLKFSSLQTDDFICDECPEKRDPLLWFYSCQDCQYDVHLDCILEKKVEGEYWSWVVPPENE